MMRRLKLLVWATAALLMALLSCKKTEEEQEKHLVGETKFSEYLIGHYVFMSQLDLDTFNYSWQQEKLVFDAALGLWASCRVYGRDKEEAKRLHKYYEPFKYNGQVPQDPSIRFATSDPIVKIECIAVTAYDDTHGEGSSLEDICKFHYSTFAPYIKAGYKITWKKSDVTRGSYLGEKACAKLLSELEYPLELLQVAQRARGFCNVDEGDKQQCSSRCCFGRFEFTSRPTKPNAMVRITVTLADERAYSFNLNMGKGVK